MSFSAKHSPRIASIGSEYFTGSDEYNAGCASSAQRNAAIIVASRIILFSDDFELILALLTLYYLVDLFESLMQCLFVLLLFVLLQRFEGWHEDLFDEFGYLNT